MSKQTDKVQGRISFSHFLSVLIWTTLIKLLNNPTKRSSKGKNQCPLRYTSSWLLRMTVLILRMTVLFISSCWLYCLQAVAYCTQLIASNDCIVYKQLIALTDCIDIKFRCCKKRTHVHFVTIFLTWQKPHFKIEK